MASSVAGPEIERLIQLLARLPGLGPRSARRAALHLIKKREALMTPLSSALQVAIEKIQVCNICGNIDTQNPCTVCTDTRRDPSIIVVVADVADLWALERAHATNGFYHVLGATLSPLDGVGPQDLTIDALVQRALDPGSPKSFSRSMQQSMARPPRTTSPTCCRMPTSRSHGWRMACRSAVSLIISMKEPCRLPCGSGRCSDLP